MRSHKGQNQVKMVELPYNSTASGQITPEYNLTR